LRLGTGATVTGRLLKDGKPLAGVSVGLVQEDRGVERFTGALSIGTDADGKFAFSNVAPAGQWVVYGQMASLGTHGALKAEVVDVGGDGSVNDAGEFAVGPTHVVSGLVMLSDGKPVPPHTRVILGRDAAWDSQTVTLDAQGRFTFRGVPPEVVSISTRVKDYHLSKQNRSLDRMNLGSIEGLIDGDIEDLCILLEPGKQTLPTPEEVRAGVDKSEANRKRRIEGIAPPATKATAGRLPL
jgi:hypothetical protein